MTDSHKPERDKSTGEVLKDLVSADEVHPERISEKGAVGIFTDILTGTEDRNQ